MSGRAVEAPAGCNTQSSISSEVVLQPATVGHRQCRAVGLALVVEVEPLLHPYGRPYWRGLEA